MRIEKRTTPGAEVRMSGTDEKPVVTGYAAVFNTKSQVLREGGRAFREVIRPGAFAAAIKDADVRALFNHDKNMVLGRTVAGTLRLAEDEKGLRYEIDPPQTALAEHAIEAIRRRDVSGSSFSFRATKDEWREENGEKVRELVEVQLYDVGPVTFPAYPDASVDVRAEEEDADAPADLSGALAAAAECAQACVEACRAVIDAAVAMEGKPDADTIAAAKLTARHLRVATDNAYSCLVSCAQIVDGDYYRSVRDLASSAQAQLRSLDQAIESAASSTAAAGDAAGPAPRREEIRRYLAEQA